MGSISPEERTYPLKKPAGHKPPVPRWSLRFHDSSITHLYTLYIGVQCHSGNTTARTKAEDTISTLLNNSTSSNPATDTFRVTEGFDTTDSKVWALYFTHPDPFTSTLQTLNLPRIWNTLPSKPDIGLWIEHFTAPISRLETNYSRLAHKPGLAQLPNTTQPAHELTAYWGAGRDRIPDSATDQFPTPSDLPKPPPFLGEIPRGYGQHLTGTNYDHMCHIRSGQWWAQCEDAERRAYEQDLQIALMDGMRYLWQHPRETGTLGLRFLQNTTNDQEERRLRETCGAGFFRNWSDLEKWSSRHPSHLAIFNGAMAHAKRFGEDRKFMTWHEVFILKAGEATMEYVNCGPETGVIKWVQMEREDL
ncbi:Hypothetical predicted protein [Lecanosticta acicola]|uniref:Phenylacetaldoxime dehydratase n=1 Tax=Lecanosticta acicola TaxID=111012 RepID=A0AAI8YUT4_9PEZI|nr:Hypothetical predicted protein [Lecanosticta acicola]